MQKMDKLSLDESGWIHCPLCGCRTRTKIIESTKAINFPIFCPKCKKEFIVNIMNKQIELSIEPNKKL